MRFLDFSSWQGVVTSIIGLALFTLIGMGLRLLMMMTIQQRQQRANRQINERLKTLIAAYKVLGGSFTGMLTVDPRSARSYRAGAGVSVAPEAEGVSDPAEIVTLKNVAAGSSNGLPDSVIERRIQKRDAVEAALSDILLLGTEDHVRLATRAAQEMVAGHPIQTHDLVVSLRNYIRGALDLEPVPDDLMIPSQGPTRPSFGRAGGGRAGAGSGGGGSGGGGAGGGGGMGGGMGMGGGGEMSGLRIRDPDGPTSGN